MISSSASFVRCMTCHGDGYVLRRPALTTLRRGGIRRQPGQPFERARCQDCSGTGDFAVGAGVGLDPKELVESPCVTCDGSGEEDCGECQGSGRVDCENCEGGVTMVERRKLPVPEKRTAKAKPLERWVA